MCFHEEMKELKKNPEQLFEECLYLFSQEKNKTMAEIEEKNQLMTFYKEQITELREVIENEK